MKKKSIISIILIVVLLILGLMLFKNKTFFKNSYKNIYLPKYSYLYEESESEVKFISIKNYNKLENEINKYLENLNSCYDENYFYDEDIRTTITGYTIEKYLFLKKITLKYVDINMCENEYVLSNSWNLEFLPNAIIEESNMYKCIAEECIKKEITTSDLETIFNHLTNSNTIRIANKNNINMEDSEYYIDVYYFLNNQNYTMMIFEYDGHLAFKVTDANDHSQNAIYNIDTDLPQLFSKIYN
ncbi:MAG TPA: hypothetical protein PLX66_02215 [Bacilli bacterium]|nr:hypothetical protein [Bacilli bacterium]